MPASLKRLGQHTLLFFAAFSAIAQTVPAKPATSGRDKPSLKLLRLPLAFEPNVGQVPPGTDFQIRTGPLQAELSATGMRLSIPSKTGNSNQVSIRLQGARPDGSPVATGKLEGESNYLLGNNPADWHQHVAHYGRVTYPDVFSGIDLTYYGTGAQLEHDFIVHPGVAPSKIHLRLDGARHLDLADSGDLRLTLDDGQITLRRPTAYQVIAGVRHEVPANFVLAGQLVTFHLGTYDRTQQLIIDPVLDYSTFLGDASIYVTGVATDAAAATYITGEAPVAFPATAQTATCNTCIAGTNKLAVFVSKLNAAGTAVVYSTFIGGSVDPYNDPANDQSSGIAVDINGNAVVIGSADTKDFPLKNPISSAGANFNNGFVLSLTPDGSSLNFSSRLGGGSSPSQSDMAYPEAVATDHAGSVYVSGLSASTSLPVTPGALHTFSPSYGTNGGFLLKLSAAGALTYGAVVGQTGNASGILGPTGLAVDESGIVSMAGTAGASDTGTILWPTTAGAYASDSYVGLSGTTPFVTRISADGSTILSSTLVGTGSASTLALTSTGDVLIAGDPGTNFPVTPDAYNGTSGGGFFAKVSKDGTQLLYSSFFSSSSQATISGIGNDPSGHVWLAGTTTGALPLLHPLQSVTNDSYSGVGFVEEFDPSLHNLLFSSYINSENGFSQIHGLALDSSGLAHIAGIASQDFPTTQNAFLKTVTPPPTNYSYNYGFAALIDASKPGPGICLAAAPPIFATAGTTATSSFNIMSCGDGPVTISSVQLTSDVFAFASSNTCTGTLAAGASCTLTYTFAPKTAGPATATVLIASDAPMAPTMEALSGTATAPIIFLPLGNSLTFAPQVLGASANFGAISIGNNGTAPLIIDTSRTTITGPFSITATVCSTPIPPGFGCTYTVAFNPVAVGTATGTITIYSNDLTTPSITVSLSGTALAAYTVPTISYLNVPTLSLDNGPVDLLINGTNFFPASTVQINGKPIPVTSSSDTLLTVTVDPATLRAMGEFPVQVFNPAPAGGSNLTTLTTYRSISLTATNLVYAPATKLLYAAIPAFSTLNPNTILPIDPTTGVSGTPIPVNANPTRLAVSDDGHYLYVSFNFLLQTVGTLQRIDLTTGKVDRTFTLPGSSQGVINMHVVPGSPQFLVASLEINASPSENGAALFNDAGLVQYIPSDYSNHDYTIDNFTFTSDPTIFYSYPFGASFFGTTSVSPTSLSTVSPGGAGCCSQATGSIVVSDGTLLYTNSGQVWDPKTRFLLGQYGGGSLFYPPGIVADSAAKRTFILEDDNSSLNSSYSGTAIASYDPATYTSAGSLAFSVQSPLYLNRWGADGFTFLAGPPVYGTNTTPYALSQLILFRSSLATPSAPGIATVTSLSPASAAAGSPAITLTVNGSNFNSTSTVLWNGAVRPTTFVSVNQLTAAISAADLAAQGTAQVNVSNSGAISPSLPFVIGGPVLTLSKHILSFTPQPVAIPSSAQTITLTSAGTAPLTGLTLDLTGTDAASFSFTSTCAGSLATSKTCTASVTFTPASVGAKQASLQITDNASDSPQVIALNGTAGVSSFTLSNQSFSFGQRPQGSNTSVNVTAQNTGNFPLAGFSTAVTGPNASDFTAVSSCGPTLGVAAYCTFSLVFVPTTIGDESATVTFSSPGAAAQTFSLSGTSTAPDFTPPAPTGSASATVPAGQPATFNFSISQSGAFTGTVTMSCGSLPAYASCTFTPSSFAVSATPTPVALSISTQQTVTASIDAAPRAPGWPANLVKCALLLALPMALRRFRRKLKSLHLLLWLIALAAGASSLSGCSSGGGGSSNPPPTTTTHTTPSGTYTISVIATSGALSHGTPVTLVVQ